MSDLNMPTRTRTSAAPTHITAFGGSRMLGRAAPLFRPEPEDGGSGETRLSRKEWERQRSAELAERERGDLASKVANLEYDLREARSKIPADGQVVVSREDAAALESYREHFGTPKEAKEARGKLVELEEKDTLRSYDEARQAALGEYGTDLPDSYKAFIPTAEELMQQPGGKERLRDLDFMKAQVERAAASYGAEKQDATERTDVGVSPGEVRAGGDPTPVDIKQAAREFVARQRGQKE